MKANLLKTFTNAEDGLEVYVTEIESGYSIRLKDTDANEFFPEMTIFPVGTDIEKVYAKAKVISGLADN